MINIKKAIVKIISLILTIFISIKYFATKILLFCFNFTYFKVCTSLKLSNCSICSEIKSQSNKQKQKFITQNVVSIDNCFQYIIDSAISLCLTTFIVDYNKVLIKLTLLFSHHVHHFFLSTLFPQLPDYSSLIEQSYSNFLTMLLIIFGFFGVSVQLACIIDLINILTLPTKLIYQILSKSYEFLIKLIGKMIEIIKKDNQKWITCQYPQFVLTKNSKTVMIGLLIIITQLTILIGFYYIWLSCVILLLIIVENILENAYRIILRFGKYISILKGYSYFNRQLNQYSSFIPILELENFLKIVKGANLIHFGRDYKNNYNTAPVFFSIYKIYNCFLNVNNKQKND